MLIEKAITADIENFGSRINASLETAITEAVVNSIQAGAKNISVKIFHFDNGNLNRIEIFDDGIGFDDVNLDSFFDLHSAHKKKSGGKGVGRVAWFKYFRRVRVDSIVATENTTSKVSFVVSNSQRSVSVSKEVLSANEKVVTTVSLEEYYGARLIDLDPEKIKIYLVKELVVMLFNLLRKDVHINIEIVQSKNNVEIARAEIHDEDIPAVHKDFSFDLRYLDADYKFNLICIRVATKSNNKVVTGFIAGERAISDFTAALGLHIHAPTSSYTGQYWILLESPLFNQGRFTTEGRDRMVFPDDSDLWGGKGLKGEIKDKVLAAITEYFVALEPDYFLARNNVVNDVIELYPQYSSNEYKAKIDEILLSTVGRLDRHDVLKKLNDLEFSAEYNIKREIVDRLRNKNITEETIENAVTFARHTSEQAKGVLANYFWYRKAIIDQLQSYIDNNERSEDLLHELFFERNATQHTASLRNCIWLLDDRFMRFSYFVSEAIVSSVVNSICGEVSPNINNEKRMDIFMKLDRPESSDSFDCIVVEFKAIGATVDDKVNAATQVKTRYALAIRDHMPAVGNLFIYIISEIDDKLKKYLKGNDFKEAYTRFGSIFVSYNEFNNAHVYYVSTSTIVGDAKDRHELFFKLLKDELMEKERWA